MSIPLLPPPGDEAEQRHSDEDGEREKAAAQDRTRHRDGKPHVAGEEECLAALSRLPSLVALGLLSTAKANAMRASYMAILQHYRQKQSPAEQASVADYAMLDMLARHPDLANLLEPVLSAEQIASILARAKDGRRGAP
jgi:hypothetical protein